MTIRPASAADVPQVLPMVVAQYALHTEWDAAKFAPRDNLPAMYSGWLRERATDKRSLFLVAEAEGAVVGFLVATVERELPIYRTQEYAFIHDLWVIEGSRGGGTGRKLLAACVAHFKAAGVLQIRLDTAYPNEGARRLFASAGFRPSAVQMLLEIA